MSMLKNKVLKIQGIDPNDKKNDKKEESINSKDKSSQKTTENETKINANPNNNKNIDEKKSILPQNSNNGSNGQGGPSGQGGPNKNIKQKKSPLSIALWVILGFLIVFLIWSIIVASGRVYLPTSDFFNDEKYGLSKAISEATADKKLLLNIEGISGGYKMSFYFNKKLVYTYYPNFQEFVNSAQSNGLMDSTNNVLIGSWIWNYTVYSPGFFTILIINWLPWLFFMVLAWVLIKKIIDSQSSTGKMNKKSLIPQISNIKFADVEGYPEIKEELSEVVDFLKNPQKYEDMGARAPKGVLLSGPPGTGKTLFAKAVAGESSIPFYSISGSDFVEMFVGVGASRVRSLFTQAKKTSPSLIFIDELDAVGRTRGSGVGGGNDEREQTLNQLLVEMDGFVVNSGIVVMAATNRPDVLDNALKRPGRFDRSIDIRLPDVKERKAILKLHANKYNRKFSKDIDWLNISMRTPGFSGAELENVINESAILAIRNNKKEITLEFIDEAIDRVIGGPAKTNNSMSKEEKELVAYHESGHALIGLMLEDAEKVQKISIVPRGQAGGYVLMTPKKEKIVQTKAELFAKIVSYMGGRVSEEIFFGKEKITTGAYSDIQEATKIARRMVTEFGMSDLGPVQLENYNNYPYSNNQKNYSEDTSSKIDDFVQKIINESYKKAHDVISKNKSMIKLFANALMIKEILNTEDIEYIFSNKKFTDEIIELEKLEKKSLKKNNSNEVKKENKKNIKSEKPNNSSKEDNNINKNFILKEEKNKKENEN